MNATNDVVKTMSNHPFGNGNHSTYTNTNGDDLGMVNMALFYSHYQVFLVESLVYSLFTNHCDLTATSLESWLVREIIPKWPQFRLVKYSNLPRYIPWQL